MVALGLAACVAVAACNRDKPSARKVGGTGDPGAGRAAGGPRDAATASAADGKLLTFARQPDPLFDWRRTPTWSDLARRRFRLPAQSRRSAARILTRGWEPQAAASLGEHLDTHRALLDRAARTPPCAPLRKSWRHAELLRQHRSLFPLKELAEALLLRARRHQHHGRPGPARGDALAALRFTCHLGQVPEVLMQLTALKAEAQALAVLAAQPPPGDRAGCQRRARALILHAQRRLRLEDVARADRLMARSQLRLITRDLTQLERPQARTRQRLVSLKRHILARASTLYARYSRLLLQGLAQGRPADWKGLDAYLGELSAVLEQLRKKHRVKSDADLSWIAARFPNRPASWTADIIARTFLGLVTMRSTIWKRARQLHRDNRRALDQLRVRPCPGPTPGRKQSGATRPPPSAAP